MRWRRILVIFIAMLVVLPIAGIGIFIAYLQSERLEAKCGDARDGSCQAVTAHVAAWMENSADSCRYLPFAVRKMGLGFLNYAAINKNSLAAKSAFQVDTL